MTTNTTTDSLAARNRRLASRRDAKRAARVECRKGALGLGKDISVHFVNLSETGIQLVVSAELPLGQEVEIILGSLGGQKFKVLGQIMWTKPAQAEGTHCIGVRFEKRVPYATLMDLTRLPESK